MLHGFEKLLFMYNSMQTSPREVPKGRTAYSIFILNHFALIEYLPFEQIGQSCSCKCVCLLSLLPRVDLKDCDQMPLLEPLLEVES